MPYEANQVTSVNWVRAKQTAARFSAAQSAWVIALWLGSFATHAADAEVRGIREYAFDSSADWLTSATHFAPWAKLLSRVQAERAQLTHCYADENLCDAAGKIVRTLVLKGRELTPEKQIQLVNRYVNRRHWRVERQRDNEWKSLLEFIREGGDCEDFAVAKYFLLRELGYAADDLRVVIAFDRKHRGYHGVLAIRAEPKALMLDVEGGARPATSDRAYDYLFALNEASVWDHTESRDRQLDEIARSHGQLPKELAEPAGH